MSFAAVMQTLIAVVVRRGVVSCISVAWRFHFIFCPTICSLFSTRRGVIVAAERYHFVLTAKTHKDLPQAERYKFLALQL